LLFDRDTTSSTRMGAGGNGNNQWEWEGNGNKTRLLNLGSGMGMGMNHRKWEEMGLKNTVPLIYIDCTCMSFSRSCSQSNMLAYITALAFCWFELFIAV